MSGHAIDACVISGKQPEIPIEVIYGTKKIYLTTNGAWEPVALNSTKFERINDNAGDDINKPTPAAAIDSRSDSSQSSTTTGLRIVCSDCDLNREIRNRPPFPILITSLLTH